MNRKLAIIGAGYLQKPLVEKANELGYETYCFAWEKGAVCKDICTKFYPISILEKEEILNICKTISIDGITSIASDAAVQTVNYIANELGLVSNPVDSTHKCTNKIEMRKAFNKKKLASPQLFSHEQKMSADYKINYPCIVKPADRSGSTGVTIVKNATELNIAKKEAEKLSFRKQIIIETFISGYEISVETITFEGKHYVLAITDKETTGPPEFVEIAHHQPSKIEANEVLLNKVKKLTIDGLNALNITFGAAHTEIIIDNTNEPYLMEIGARMGGDFIGSDLVYLSTGFDYLTEVINIAFGIFNKPIISKNSFSGVYFVTDKTINKLNYFNTNKQFIYKSEINHNKIKVVKESADRAGYIIYKANKRIEL
jgi:biotin carboxylase